MHGNYRRNFLFGGVGNSGKQSAAAAGTMPKVTSSPAGVLAQPHPSDLKTNEAGTGQKTSFAAQQQHQQPYLSTQTASGSPINNTSGRAYANHFGHLSPAQQHYAQQQQQHQQQQQRHQFCSNAQQQRSSSSSAHKMLGSCGTDEQQLHGCGNYSANNNNSHGQDDCSQLDADQYASQLRNLSIQSSRSVSGRGQPDQQQQHHHHQQQHHYGGLMQSNNQQQQKWIHSKQPQLQQPKDQKHYSMTSKSQEQTDQMQTRNGNSIHDYNNHRQQSTSASSSANTTPAQSSSSSLRVNFNRANRSDDDDSEQPGESRKKKYLTAKYGQQQMNLIKKRLKIETWLHEQLQELAKSIDAEAELDEIDIDLDQLLDMEDDETRQHWLKKTLEPFEGLPSDKLEKFIGQVLEQSKLL